jgi:hypothetical protein
MKSSYELAMERLSKASPTVKLSTQQKKEIAELESKCAAKIAEREIATKKEVDLANHAGEWDKAEELKQQLINERKKLLADLEEKKEKARKSK